jgi:cysteine desulfurase
MIYLDNNATTQVAPEVLDAMQASRQEIEQARERVAALVDAADTSEIVFTSGGSESNNRAIRGALAAQPTKKHIVTTLVEHESVRNLCRLLEKDGYEVTWLGVDENGELDLDCLRALLRLETAVVSIMMANHETGVLFPIDEIGRIVRENSDALFHVDGVQAVGKVPINLQNSEVDLFTLSGHKLHGPRDVGALYVRQSLALSGSQPQIPNIAGLGVACQLAFENDSTARIQNLRDLLENGILKQVPNARLNGVSDPIRRLPNTSNISFEYVEGENILLHLDRIGIRVATGSACHSTTHESSPTLRAMNVPYTAAQGSIRFSLSRYNTQPEIEIVLRILPGIVAKLAAMSPYTREIRVLGEHRCR